MSNSNIKRASSVENKSKPIDLPRKLKVETAVTHKKPDLRTFNKYVTLLRDAYDKGYANTEYLTTGNVMNGWKRPDNKPVTQPVDKPVNKTVTQLNDQPVTKTVTIPYNQPVTEPVIIPNQLNNNDYRDPNRHKLDQSELKQTTLDQYQKNITGTKTVRLNNEHQALLKLMKREPKPIPIKAANKTKNQKKNK